MISRETVCRSRWPCIRPNDLGQVRLQPVLLGVLAGGLPQVADHPVDVVLELRDLAGGLDRDRPRQVALGHGRGDLGDRAHLRGQVAGELVDVVGQALPGAGHARHVGLAAELALGADLAGHAGDLGGEGRELGDHRVDASRFSSRISPWASTVMVCERSPSATAVATWAMLRTWLVRLLAMKLTESVRPFQVPATPGTSAWPPRMPSVPTSRATRVTSAAKERSWSTMRLMVSARVATSPLASTEIFCDRSPFATAVVTCAIDRTWPGEVVGHDVDGVRERLPGAGHARHVGLTAQPSLGAHLAGHAGDLGGEGRELVDHRVDGLLELQDLAAGVDRDLLREVAVGHRRRDLGDVAHLAGQVVGHEVDRVGQVLPGAGHARDLGLAAEDALGAHLARDAGHLLGEDAQGVGHRVDGVGEGRDLALGVDRDRLREVAVRDRRRHLGDVAHLVGEVVRHRVDGVGQVLPGARDARGRPPGRRGCPPCRRRARRRSPARRTRAGCRSSS